MKSAPQIIKADLENRDHQQAVIALTAAYALEPTGNGGPLPSQVLARLIAEIQNHPPSLIFLAYNNGEPVGIATCFVGFSTFAARPLINISDLAILPDRRRPGSGRALPAHV